MNYLKTDSLLSLEHTLAKAFLAGYSYPWEALKEIETFLLALGETLSPKNFTHPRPDVWIAKSAQVYPSAYIHGPCIIDENAQIRHCAFIRGNALIGKEAVVGNSTEIKNAILFDGVQVPHYNYVGDSILGYRAHMGAGAITSNVRSDKRNIAVHAQEDIQTGLRKFGAILGDDAEIGCNNVLCPGSIVGKRSIVYPLSRVRGIVPANHIYKNENEIVERLEQYRG